jgi:hypothetical protein
MVVAEKGCGNIKVYEFPSSRAARNFYFRQWVARVLVDESGRELLSSSGWNVFALRTIRLWVNSLHRATEIRDMSLSTIAVSRLSGETFEAEFKGSATIRDVKDAAARFWGINAAVQKMILETRVQEEDDRATVASLVALHGAGTINLTMIATNDLIEVRRKIRYERSLPTNVTSIRNLKELLSRERALAQSDELPMMFRLI